MAITLRLGEVPCESVHVALSPLTELMALLHALAEPEHHVAARPDLARVRQHFDPATADEFQTFTPLWARFRCRLFFPTRPGAPSSVPEQLAELAAAPILDFVRLAAEGIHGFAHPLPTPEALLEQPDATRHFVRLCRARSGSRGELAEALVTDPHELRRRLLAFLRACHDRVFEPEWRRLEPILRRSAARTATALRGQPLHGVIGELSDTATILPELNEVSFDKLQQRVASPGSRGLLLVPSVWVEPHLTVKDTPGLPVVIHFPVPRGNGATLGIQQLRQRLAALASESRMEIFRHLSAEPITTSELAMRLGQSSAQISRSLGELRRAGLVISERRGKHVLHRIDTGCVLRLGPDILATLVR